MFKALQPLLATLASLTVSLVANTDGTITVTVIPRGGKEGSTLNSPLTLTGTPEELNAGFVGCLDSYIPKHLTLSEQLAATEAILEAAQKEATDKAKKSIAKPTKKSSAPVVENSGDSGDEGEGDDNDDVAEHRTTSTSSSPATSTNTATTTAPAAPSLWD